MPHRAALFDNGHNYRAEKNYSPPQKFAIDPSVTLKLKELGKGN
jgi:hypothetical protein